jgi:hypothetical protein
MKVWVDPPSGWKYGFPKLWDCQGSLQEWLVREGYPKREIDSCNGYFYVRQWTDEDLNRQVSQGLKETAQDLGQD